MGVRRYRNMVAEGVHSHVGSRKLQCGKAGVSLCIIRLRVMLQPPGVRGSAVRFEVAGAEKGWLRAQWPRVQGRGTVVHT